MGDKKRLAVLVSSCDAYKDVWSPFFKLMDKYWADLPYNVYLNTERERYDDSQNSFKVTSLNLKTKKNVPWGKRMIDVLNRIEEEYVFVLIEDFFLRENVQTELIEELLDKMDGDQLIAQVQFFGTRTNCDNERKNIAISEMDLQLIGDDKAKICFVPTIWRKSTLLKWLRKHESIWAFESLGARRVKRWKYKERVYRVYSPAIFNYLWEKGCYSIVNGKWMLHPLLLELFKNNDISIDFNERGTITMEEWNAKTMKDIIKSYTFWQIVKKVFNRFRSFF